MIKILQKNKCCACQACANICPKHCISMQADSEGFLYPRVDKTICVNCNLCEKVCPILNKPQTFPVLQAYAAKHKNSEIKLKSSSGGIFTALAKVILKEGGIVFGAAFDKNWNVIHTYAENIEDLDKLRRSKYVQSDIGKTYQQAKIFLEKDRKVLFTGTPCQIAGLRNYLGKEYQNLLTAELFCHGVPSPAVWQKFLAENTQKQQITSIDFRYKRFAWDASFLNITYKDGSCLPSAPRFLFPLLNAKKGFLFRNFYHLYYGISNLYERPSCHECHFKGLDKMADFSIGDLWGVQQTYPALYDKQGISAIFLNTAKAKAIFNTLSLQTKSIDIQKITKYNPYVLTSVKPHPKRAEFFKRYKTENFNKLLKELLNIKSPVYECLIRLVIKIKRK